MNREQGEIMMRKQINKQQTENMVGNASNAYLAIYYVAMTSKWILLPLPTNDDSYDDGNENHLIPYNLNNIYRLHRLRFCGHRHPHLAAVYLNFHQYDMKQLIFGALAVVYAATTHCISAITEAYDVTFPNRCSYCCWAEAVV